MALAKGARIRGVKIIEDRPVSRETIYRNDEHVGLLSSAGWGYTVKRSIGFGCVRHTEGVDTAMLKSGA